MTLASISIRGEEVPVVRKGGIVVVARDSRQQQPVVLDCQYRGELLGSINCGCGSVNRETEVFKCAIFGSCTLTAIGGRAGWLKLGLKKRPAYCRTCEERTP